MTARTATGERVAPTPFVLSTDAPVLRPLEGAAVLAQVVLNLEHWTLDRPMPRAALPAPHGLSVVPDVANHSWVLYGLRVGLPRVARALAPLGTKVTVALNAEVIERYPAVADLVESYGWEVAAHGLRQQSVQSVDDEAAWVAGTVEAITARFGAPRGWLSPGMNQTDDSLAHLARHGIAYNHDWMVDDRPVWLDSAAGPVLGLPYTLTLNDVTVYQVAQLADGALLDRTRRTLAVHLAEGAANPVVMPVGLHPHVMGVPHRIAELEQIVELLVGTPGVRAVTAGEVHDWYAAQVPAPLHDEVRAFTHLSGEAPLTSGPLAGTAVAVKEIIDVAGMPTTYGSGVFADRVPSADAEAVARLRAAGAHVAGMVTTTPYACGTTTVTDNPAAPGYTPGGSSAGSGAAVGAGLVSVALGSQSQASTLRPASYCGVWGFKPTHLRLPRDGMHLLADDLDDLGVLAATRDDLAAVLPVLADDWRDVARPARLRVGVVRLDDGDLPDEETRTALAALVDRFATTAAVEVVRGTPPLVALDEALAGSGLVCFDIFAGQSAPALASYVAAGEPDPRLGEMVAHAEATGPDGLALALQRRAVLAEQYAALSAEVDVLLTLATTGPAPYGHDSTGCRRMPATSSLLGVPALSAPWLTVDGRPLGVQLLGFAGRDEELLAAAHTLQILEEETR
ncbi:MAG: amidase family protein [Nocardioides sp.]|uniref:amidase family protein n=1 Tax=Nocardioides sp. TaxID=35761 RepID=UPI003F0C4E48